MPAAGGYVDRLEWLKRTPGAKDTHGQRSDTYPSQGYLWGAVEDLSGSRGTAKESERAEATATIRLRNYPAVAARDRLVDGWGDTWTVESVVRGDNEVLCDVQRPGWTAGGGTAS